MKLRKQNSKLLKFTFLPFIALLLADQMTKFFALKLLLPKVIGPFTLCLLKNQGVIMGSFATLPPVLKIVSLSTAGAFILVVFGCFQFFLPFQPRTLRLGMAMLVSGIIGNVLDRILHGYVIDFLVLGTLKPGALVMNFADIIQWFGYLFIVVSLIKDRAKFSWDNTARKLYWINPRFQLKYCMTLLFFVLSMSLILGVYSYTYLVVALGSNASGQGSFIASFTMSFVLVTFIFCAFSAIMGLFISHRIAGPVYSFTRFARILLDGKSAKLKLRKHDDFQELESIAEEMAKKYTEIQSAQMPYENARNS